MNLEGGPGSLRFIPLSLREAFVVEPSRGSDERGFFARVYCQDEFERAGLVWRIAQCSISFNPRRGTLRGMHYQDAPHSEAKVIRCTRGAIYDVIVDLRPDSATRGEWQAVELTEENRLMVYAPEGFAHGFLTLTDDTEVFYQISEPYRPDFARGVRWDDLAFGIRWPFTPQLISARDRSYPDYVK